MLIEVGQEYAPRFSNSSVRVKVTYQNAHTVRVRQGTREFWVLRALFEVLYKDPNVIREVRPLPLLLMPRPHRWQQGHTRSGLLSSDESPRHCG